MSREWISCLMAQTLDRVLTSYRIGDPRRAYPIFDATGSTQYPGFWNTTASPMINRHGGIDACLRHNRAAVVLVMRGLLQMNYTRLSAQGERPATIQAIVLH
jgi:RES domain-containing protein